MKINYATKFILSLTLITLIYSCKKTANEEVNLTGNSQKIILDNNANSLANRVKYVNANGAVSKLKSATISIKSSVDLSKYSLQLIAEVTAPTYEGKTLQATHIDMVGNKVYVSYNTRGETYLGGVDVFDVSNESHPVLVSQAIMPNTDISSIAYNDNNVYLASATDVDKDGSLTSPAVLDKISLNNGLLSTQTNRIQLKGYVGKNILISNNKIYAVSSTQGGLSVINPSTFVQEKFVAYNSSTAIATNASGNNIFVLKDQPGEILSLNLPDLSTAKTISLNGNLPETQSSIETINDNFLYSGGRKGLSYLGSTGNLIDNLPVPSSIAGIDDADIVTNNSTTNNGLIYIANGAAGVTVAKLENNTLVLLGQVDLDGSANYVKSNGNLLFVATGNGGLKILKITLKNPSSSTVACESRTTLNSDQNGYRNLNSGTKEYFRGSTVLGGLNVNDNSIFDFCGSFVLNYASNINTNGTILINGSFVARQQLNINGYGEFIGSFGVNNTLTVNSNGRLKLFPTASSGEIYAVDGDFNVNGNAEVNNSTLKLNQKLSINSSGKLKLINTNLIVNGDFDLNGTIEFVGNCNVIVNGKYTKNSGGHVIGTQTGKQL